MEPDELQTSRMVARELYAKGVATRIRRLLTRLELNLSDDLAAALARLSKVDERRLIEGTYTTERLRRLIDLVQVFSVEWTGIVKQQLESGGLDLIKAEIEFERRYLAAVAAETALPPTIAASLGATISPAQIFNGAKRRPMQTRLMRELWPDMTRSVRRRATDALRQSYQAGETIGQATARLRRDLKVNKNGAEAIARTGLAHYSHAATSDTLARLGVERVQWVSTLDSRTTTICRSLDGQIFRLADEKRPTVPRHIRCRSAIIPHIEGVMGAGDTRASKGPDGGKQVSAKLTYETWLRRQPKSYAREILGKTQYDIWKTGVPVTKFTDKNATRAFTAQELRAKYSTLFPDQNQAAA